MFQKLNITFGVSSKVPGITKNKYPHDLTIGPAPMKITGVENRYLAVYISSTSQGVEVGGIDMYVLVPDALKEELQVLKENCKSVYAIEFLACLRFSYFHAGLLPWTERGSWAIIHP